MVDGTAAALADSVGAASLSKLDSPLPSRRGFLDAGRFFVAAFAGICGPPDLLATHPLCNAQRWPLE